MNKDTLLEEVRKVELVLNLADRNGNIDTSIADDVWHLIDCINKLDEPETLSHEWIDENKVARIDNLRKMTTSDVVPVEKLKNLLLPIN